MDEFCVDNHSNGASWLSRCCMSIRIRNTHTVQGGCPHWSQQRYTFEIMVPPAHPLETVVPLYPPHLQPFGALAHLWPPCLISSSRTRPNTQQPNLHAYGRRPRRATMPPMHRLLPVIGPRPLLVWLQPAHDHQVISSATHTRGRIIRTPTST